MSSTLQISLAVGGGFVLAGLVAHSAWSARKNQPKQPSPAPTPPSTPSTPSASTSPASVASSSLKPPAPLPVATTSEKIPPAPSAGGLAASPNPHPEAATQASSEANLASLVELNVLDKKLCLDILIDTIASVSLESAISGEAVLAAMPSTRRVGSKPFGIEGLSQITAEWEYPMAGQRYSAFQCGVQLANRTGALNQIEFSEFVVKTRAFADAIGAEAQFPDMLEEVARARELDHFAVNHDAQLNMTLRAVETAWTPGYVQQCAAKLGFVSGLTPGRMTLPATRPGHYPPILALLFDSQAAQAEKPTQTALREFSLALDVPQVLRAEQPFARMCEIALKLAAHMEGVIVDDDGNRISAEAMEIIYADLETLYDRLDMREMSAGSVLGRRLFS